MRCTLTLAEKALVFIKWSHSIICRSDTWNTKCQKCKNNFPTVRLWANAVKLPYDWCFHPQLCLRTGGKRNPKPVHIHFRLVWMISGRGLVHFSSVWQVRKAVFKQCKSDNEAQTYAKVHRGLGIVEDTYQCHILYCSKQDLGRTKWPEGSLGVCSN